MFAPVTDDAYTCDRNLLGTIVRTSWFRGGGGGDWKKQQLFSDANASRYPSVPQGKLMIGLRIGTLEQTINPAAQTDIVTGVIHPHSVSREGRG